MVNSKTQNILVVLFIIIAIAVLILAFFVFFKPQKELTGHELLDCVHDDVQLSKIRECLEKFPQYKNNHLLDQLTLIKAGMPNPTRGDLCNQVIKESSRNFCLALVKQDNSYCQKIDDPFSVALCLGKLGQKNACDNFPSPKKDDCLVSVSDDPSVCSLLSEYEKPYCIALKKRDPATCMTLPSYPKQIRCLALSDISYVGELEEYYIFENFFGIIEDAEKYYETCNYVKDDKFEKVCKDKFN